MAKRVTDENRLSIRFPELIKEWHPVKNNELKPSDVSYGSNKKIWWSCSKGHHYDMIVNQRTIGGSNCPFCSNRRVCDDNSLTALNPEMASEWHPIKNGDLTPDDVVVNSHKRAWWLCKNGHEWEAQILSRNHFKSKCPYCSGFKTAKEKSIGALFPELAKQWHPTKNGNLTPFDVLPRSDKKIWWICKEGHESYVQAKSRIRGHECPYCTGRYAVKETSFLAKYPRLAKEWHPTKNTINPDEVLSASGFKVWWKCKKGHEWETRVADRTSGKGCPYCQLTGTSKPEILLFFLLDSIFDGVKHHYTVDHKGEKWEFDIYIESIKLAIEYDGERFHKTEEKIIRDKKKNVLADEIGFHLLRIRQKGLPSIHINEIFVEASTYPYLKPVDFQIVLDYLKNYLTKNSYDVLPLNQINNDSLYEWSKKISEGIELPNNITITKPELLVEWNYEKNNWCEPHFFTKGSNATVWWKCKKGHEWQSSISNKTKGHGCPFCSGRNATKETSFLTIHPELSKEWHPTKNSLSPSEFTFSSGQKVWWLCPIGHEYDMVVRDRHRGSNCPYCSNKRIVKESSIVMTHPEIVPFWDFEKNDTIRPENVSSGSHKEYNWICQNSHSWCEKVYIFINKKEKCNQCQSLAFLYPELIADWDYEKNTEDPNFVFKSSGKKYWWICQNGHETHEKIKTRKKRLHRCIKCEQQKKS